MQSLEGNKAGTDSHIAELDGIRGCAVIMVLVYHYVTCQRDTLTSKTYSFLFSPTYLFWSGVDLFFVLSGFLIGGILFDHRHRPNFLRAFFVRRAARILPAYVLLLGMYFVACKIFKYDNYAWLMEGQLPLYSYLTFSQNVMMGIRGDFGCNFLAVTWSLAVEEQFYIALPLLAVFLSNTRFVQCAIALAIMAPFIRLAFPGFHTSVNMPFRMDSLLVGVILASIKRSPDLMEVLRNYKTTIWTMFLSINCGLIVVAAKGVGREFLSPSIIAIFYGLGILLALLHQGQSNFAFLRTKLLGDFGRYSYGLYLYHQVIAGILHGYLRGSYPTIATLDGIAVTILSAFASYMLAVASYSSFESFFLKLGRKFAY